jgi:hypothetical protein
MLYAFAAPQFRKKQDAADGSYVADYAAPIAPL